MLDLNILWKDETMNQMFIGLRHMHRSRSIANSRGTRDKQNLKIFNSEKTV